MQSVHAHPPVNPAKVERLERLLRDLRQLLEEGTPPPEALDTAPILDGWSRTLVPGPGLIGRVVPAGETVTNPLYAISATGRWARTDAGWVRLARHCAAAPPRRG